MVLSSHYRKYAIVRQLINLSHLVVQVSSSEWVLGVEIQHFENVYNAEIRNGMYCCCDAAAPCGGTIDAIQPMTCTIACDPYIVIYFQACIQTCYVAKLLLT